MATADESHEILSYHNHIRSAYARDESVGVTVGQGKVKLSGSVFDSSADPSEGSNEYDWTTVEVDLEQFLHGLATVQKGDTWTHTDPQDGGGSARVSMRGLSVGSRSIYSPGPAQADLTAKRFGLLMLDVREAFDFGAAPAKTGTHSLAGHLDAAFLRAIRQNPSIFTEFGPADLSRTIHSIVRDANAGPVDLEPYGRHENLWLVRPRDSAMGTMLLSVLARQDGRITVDVVDRLNGIRDRNEVAKSAIVTLSSFTADVTRAYEGLQRIDLVDYDRLTGVLAEGGWESRSTGFLKCPVTTRPAHLVFISYSHQETAFATWLHNRLHGWQYNCFLDNVDMHPGDVILSAVKQAVESSDVVIVCVSQSSMASPWVQAEVKFALDREKRTGRSLLIPVRLDDAAIPHDLRALQDKVFADFRRWSPERSATELQRLLTAVDTTLGQP